MENYITEVIGRDQQFRLVTRCVRYNGNIAFYRYIPLTDLLYIGWTERKAKAYYGIVQGPQELLCPLDEDMYMLHKDDGRVVPPCEIDVDPETDVPKIINVKQTKSL